jgi:hypothetical protein
MGHAFHLFITKPFEIPMRMQSKQQCEVTGKKAETQLTPSSHSPEQQLLLANV